MQDRAWKAYLAVGVVAGAVYFLVPPVQGNGLLFNAIGLSAAVAILAGVRRHRPVPALPWYCFAAAQVVFVIGDLVYYTFDVSFPNVGDAFYLAFYPLQVAGLLLLIRRRTPGRDRAGLIDAGIITMGLGVLVWVFLMEPYTRADGTLPARLVSMAYPLMDVLLLCVAARLAVGAGARPRAFWLLMGGIVLLLATDSAYGYIELTSGYNQGGLLDVGWIACYLLWGAAALHPSMAALAAPGAPPEVRMSRHRLALLAGATLMAPAVEVIQDLRAGGDAIPVVAVASAVLFLLVLARLAGLLAHLRRSLEREQALALETAALHEEVDRHRTFHDALTSLGNRALFLNRLDHTLGRRRANGPRSGVLHIDLDDFGAVNDRLGHAAGDALIVAVARRLETCVRPTDTPARIGGDEFAVLMTDLGEDDEAVRIADRILASFDEPFALPDSGGIRLRASIGIACAAVDGDGAEALLRNAEVASFTAKSRGKARCEPFEPHMHRRTLELLELKADLQMALDQEQFVLHYQPIVWMGSGEVAGVEALLRWAHPERGLVPPADFIPVCEQSGLIVPIGRMVLEESCRQAARWQRELPGGAGLYMSVNLSVVQLAHPGVVDDVAAALQASGLDPGRLVLEMTESTFIDADAAIATLAELKGLGVLLALDDFGTGYSSLSYLDRLPVDVLKIDRSFTQRITADCKESALARAIIGLGPTLGLKTIAEGIETPEQWDSLRTLGCDLGQGYLMARPLDVRGIEALWSAAPHTFGAPADGAPCAA